MKIELKIKFRVKISLWWTDDKEITHIKSYMRIIITCPYILFVYGYIQILHKEIQRALRNFNAAYAKRKSCNNGEDRYRFLWIFITPPTTPLDLNIRYVSAIIIRNYSRFRQQRISATCYPRFAYYVPL